MKKYFAKYLPVEGEIKEGDTIQHNYTGLRRKCDLHDGQTDISLYKDFIKLKLFLCSPDIQLGDRVSWIVNDKLQSDIPSTQKWIDFAKEGGCFKVIGEISPEAIWVKEGDEFDEDEIKPIYAAPIKKTFRNGEKKHILYFDEKLSDDILEDRAKYWAEHENLDGHNYGYDLYWNEEPIYISHIKIKSSHCKYFH